jgi:hypothetical protein
MGGARDTTSGVPGTLQIQVVKEPPANAFEHLTCGEEESAREKLCEKWESGGGFSRLARHPLFLNETSRFWSEKGGGFSLFPRLFFGVRLDGGGVGRRRSKGDKAAAARVRRRFGGKVDFLHV